MPTISNDTINQVLSEADQLSRGQAPISSQPVWLEIEDQLATSKIRSYLGILCLTLVARAANSSIDVRHFKVKSSSAGYSAQAIGRRLIPFAAEQGIDLRTESTQIVNAQPFTHVSVLTRDIRDTPEWHSFFDAVDAVQTLTSEEALHVLALFFKSGRSRRISRGAVKLVTPSSTGIRFLHSVSNVVANYVEQHAEGGRVGQALGGALFDIAFGELNVTVPKINDPGFTVPGDFRAGADGAWAMGEAKQKPVTTGTVSGFIRQCVEFGGWRAVYLALGNQEYPHNIDTSKLSKQFDGEIDFTVLQSPKEAIQHFTTLSPGSAEETAGRIAQRFVDHSIDLGVEPEALADLRASLGELGFE